jgi:hypothetical protein
MDPEDREHHLVRQIRSGVKRATPGTYGLIRGRLASVDFAVTPDSVDRGLRVLDRVLKVLEDQGIRVLPSKPGEPRALLEVDGLRFRLRLTEKVNQTEHKATREERLRASRESWFRPPRWDYTGSGYLALWAIEAGRSWGLSWKRQESRVTRLDSESSLRQIVLGLRDLSVRIKAHEDAEHKRAEELEVRRRIDEELRERTRREQKRVERLREEAAAWKEAERVRSYSAAVEARLRDEVEISKLQEWLVWTGRVAAGLDPIENGEAKNWFTFS